MFKSINPSSSNSPPNLDYKQLYKQSGNLLNSTNGMDIPIFTCGHSFGDIYARSVSFGLSKIFSFQNSSTSDIINQIYAYMLDVCQENARSEDCHQIYTQLIHLLAERSASVFALSYKHEIFRNGECGRRQRVSRQTMLAMAEEIVAHAKRSKKPFLCFWLDQILGQRKPKAERNWVNNGLLPYAVFNTIVFPYTAQQLGAWLMAEKVLASGRAATQTRHTGSELISRNPGEGGPDSLMRAASAFAHGAIDGLRGSYEDKCHIVNWAVETLDMSEFMSGNQVGHFTKVFHARKPWTKRRLSSLMYNLEILPGEMERSGGQENGPSWQQEKSLFSVFVPIDLTACCDGSWLSKGRTCVFATDSRTRFVYLQTIRRALRPRLVIAAIVTREHNTSENRVLRYFVASFDELSDQSARAVFDEGREFITWAPVARFLREQEIVVCDKVEQFDGKWNCR